MTNLSNCNIDLFPAMTNTKNGSFYGYINSNGNFIIKPQFTMAMNFNSNELAIVSNGDFYGLINSSGQYVTKPIYSYINPFVEDRAIFSKGNIMGVLDENGTPITTKEYSFIENYSDSLALATINTKDGQTLYGYIDKNGNEAIPFIYIQGTSFQDGYALVQTSDDIYQIIDKSGNIKTILPYKYVWNFNSGLMTFSEESGGPIGYIDILGNVILKPQFTMAYPANDNYLIVSKSDNYIGKYGVIDLKNNLIYPFVYNDIIYLGNNRFALGIARNDEIPIMNNIYALGTEKGVILTPFKFKNIENFNNNITSASNLKNTFFIDLCGKTITTLPIVSGTGNLSIECGLVYANVDYSPFYLTVNNDIIYKPNTVIPLNDKYSVIKEKYKPNVNYLVYYPQVDGVENNNIELDINKNLKKISNLEKVTNDMVLDYNLYGSFNVLFFKKDLFIPNISYYYYPFGAAHGMTYKKTPSINLKTGEFYNLDDLFKANSNWTQEINKIIETLIRKDKEYSYVNSNGFTGIYEDQPFYVDSNNLYIYFAPYDIAPYAAGFVTFKIPFKDIDDLINKNGSFYKSFN